MKLKLIVVLSLLSASAYAEPVPANSYECRGAGVSVSYATTSFTGEPTLTVTTPAESLSQSGEQISIQDTVLGKLVSIVTEQTPDLSTETLTLVVPDVNVTDTAPQVRFTSELFTTTTHTSIGGPALVTGPVQESKSKKLVCKASLLNF
ncbi:hypothetical protein [Methylomicrobium lacus]|uniref:hypothetical protein n=1 Tax=Methylomicrobium lacus TaxID=136992 RepID=UPI0035A8EEC4